MPTSRLPLIVADTALGKITIPARALDVAMERYLPHSSLELRGMISDRMNGGYVFNAIANACTYLVILAAIDERIAEMDDRIIGAPLVGGK